MKRTVTLIIGAGLLSASSASQSFGDDDSFIKSVPDVDFKFFDEKPEHHEHKPSKHHEVKIKSSKEEVIQKEKEEDRHSLNKKEADVEVSTKKSEHQRKSKSVDKDKSKHYNSERHSEIEKNLKTSAKEVAAGRERNGLHSETGELKGKSVVTKSGLREGGMMYEEHDGQSRGLKVGEMIITDIEVKEHIKAIKHKDCGRKIDRKRWMKRKSHRKSFQERYGAGKKHRNVNGNGKNICKIRAKNKVGGKREGSLGSSESKFIKVNKRDKEIETDLEQDDVKNVKVNEHQEHDYDHSEDESKGKRSKVEKEVSVDRESNKDVEINKKRRDDKEVTIDV